MDWGVDKSFCHARARTAAQFGESRDRHSLREDNTAGGFKFIAAITHLRWFEKENLLLSLPPCQWIADFQAATPCATEAIAVPFAATNQAAIHAETTDLLFPRARFSCFPAGDPISLNAGIPLLSVLPF